MDLENYYVVFKGEIIEGHHIESVKEKLGRYFKKGNAEIDRLFSGKQVIIKKNAPLTACRKVKKAFHDAGAICHIAKSKKGSPPPPVQKIPSSVPAALPKSKKKADGNTPFKLLIPAGIIGGIAIIGILAAIAIPNFVSYRNRAHIASINTELVKVKNAETQYFSNYQRYTDSLAALNIYITTPDIRIQIVHADENCFQAKGTHLEAKVESWIDCNTTNLSSISNISDSYSETERHPGADKNSRPSGKLSDNTLFTSSDGSFEVLLPAEPTYNVQAVQTPAGKIDIHIFMVEKKDYACIVGYSDYPAALMEQADHNTLLDGAANGAVNNINAAITYQENIDLDGYDGKEITFTIQKSFKMPRGGNGKARFFIADNRLYQILKIGTNVISDMTTDSYLESFKILL